jgi:hypothetical protein
MIDMTVILMVLVYSGGDMRLSMQEFADAHSCFQAQSAIEGSVAFKLGEDAISPPFMGEQPETTVEVWCQPKLMIP